MVHQWHVWAFVNILWSRVSINLVFKNLSCFGFYPGRKPALYKDAVFYCFNKYILLVGFLFTYTRGNIAHKKNSRKVLYLTILRYLTIWLFIILKESYKSQKPEWALTKKLRVYFETLMKGILFLLWKILYDLCGLKYMSKLKKSEQVKVFDQCLDVLYQNLFFGAITLNF